MKTLQAADRSFRGVAILVAVWALLAGILWYFHDRFWWPPDDGAYAYVADRINQGAVLHRDVQDVHMGLVNFTNALALRAFGNDFVSMRYPLVFLSLLQAVLLSLLFWRRSLLAAVAVSGALALLTFLQFANPTANWYAFFLVCMLIFILHAFSRCSAAELFCIGVFLGLIFCYRQLSGVLAGIGTVSYLLYRLQPTAAQCAKGAGSTWLSRAVPCVMLLGCVAYLLGATGNYFLCVFGLPAVALLARQVIVNRVENGAVLRMLSWLLLGGSLPVLVLAWYFQRHDALLPWMGDTFFAAHSISQLPFIENRLYAAMLQFSISQLASLDFVRVVNGVFWACLLLAPLVLGLSLLSRFRTLESEAVPAVVYVPVFFALVSGHYEIPIYLMYSSALTLTALAWQAQGLGPRALRVAGVALIALVAVGAFFHAAQPLSRGLRGQLQGDRIIHRTPCDLPRCSLHVDPEMAAIYHELVELVDAQSRPGETLLAIPFNPEFNYLTGRESPLRAYNSAVGLRDSTQVREAIARLVQEPPRFVFFNPNDKYYLPIMDPLLAHVREHYAYLGATDSIEVYMLPE